MTLSRFPTLSRAFPETVPMTLSRFPLIRGEREGVGFEREKK